MNGYSWISIVSLFCYLFLFLTFLAAKKTKRVIYTFMDLLVVMILWNGGSLCMRLQLWPSVNLWHHVSLLGMMLLPVAYYLFVLDFLEEKSGWRRFWLIFYLVLFAVNAFTNFFVPLPEVLIQHGSAQFIYNYGWPIYLLFFFVILSVVQLIFIIRRHCKGNRIALQQLTPVICGIGILLLGHMLATLSLFAGLPLDILSGVINAFFLFYALYKKQLFRMTVLLSKTTYCSLALILGIAIFSNFALTIQRFFMEVLEMEYMHSMIIIAVAFVILLAILYFIINASFDAVFIRTEQQQNELLARFGEEITHMLSVDEILQGLSDTIQEAINVDRLFVFILNADGNFRIEFTPNPLEEKNFYIRADHPIVSYFKTHSGCVLLQDFSRTTIYRSMWEKEKRLLRSLNIDCFAPLMSENELVGLIALAEKKDRKPYQANDLMFLQSAAGICAVAVKNAYTYEKAIEDARKDELTGLINRKFFFELLDREFARYKDTALSLCLMNVDDFKLYNQLYGHQEGNLALQKIAGILQSSINEIGHAARIGSKEFALILPGYDIYSAKCLAENICAQINEINCGSTGETTSRLTVSAGICAAPYMASSSKELFKNADTAVYTVKRSGKNAVLMYSAEVYRRENIHKHKSGYSEHASTIYALTAAIDTKDHYTFRHSQNVAYYASELAKAAGMNSDLVEIVKEASLLHDIGKIGIREDILNKPGKLTPDEFEIMKGHVENAVNIIRYLPSLDYVIPTVLSHHEHFDGRGYPRRLAGEEIPIMGRILALADAYDAMTSLRTYKEPISPAEAVKNIREESGKKFDPHLVDLFCELVESGKLEARTQLTFVPDPPATVNIQPPDDTYYTETELAPEMQD